MVNILPGIWKGWNILMPAFVKAHIVEIAHGGLEIGNQPH